MRNFCRILFILGLSGCVAKGEAPLFTYNQKDYNRSDLPKETQQELFNLDNEYHQARRAKIQAAVIEIYLKDLAATEKVSVEEARHKFLPQGEPSEDEMQAFFDRQKGELPYSYEVVKAEIREWLIEELRKERELQILQKIAREKNVMVYGDEPVAPTFAIETAGFPKKGPKNSTVTLVEYADFTCPECGKATKEVAVVLKNYGEKIQYVYKYFPRNTARIGEKAARAGHCAHEQDKFWVYHDYAFSNQIRLGWETDDEIAKLIGGDAKAFKECMKSPKTAETVRKSFDEGKDFGVRGTPTFFINGRQILSGYSREALSAEIEKSL